MNDSNITHPWFDLLINEGSSFSPQLDSLGQYDDPIRGSSDLLNYPLIECSIDLPLDEYMICKAHLAAVNRIIKKKDQARAEMRSMVRRLLKKYKYPPEGQEEALNTVIAQCEMWADN